MVAGRGRGGGRGGRGRGGGRAVAARGIIQKKVQPRKIIPQPKQKQKQVTVVPKKQQPTINAGGSRHTLILIQDIPDKKSRTWNEYDSLAAALDGFTEMYEKQLRNLNPGTKQLSYTVADLHVYIDALHDLSALVLDPASKQYAPRGKDFIKSELLKRLKQAAGK